LAVAGSLVSNALILLMSVAIFASEAIDDSIDKSSPLEAMDYEFLGFLGLGSHWMIFSARSSSQLDLQRGPIPEFRLSARTPLGTWFSIMFSFDNLVSHREPNIAAISLYRGEGIVPGDL